MYSKPDINIDYTVGSFASDLQVYSSTTYHNQSIFFPILHKK